MTEDELLQRLQAPEDQLNERKPESLNDRQIRKTLVAFANSAPSGSEAILFIGVEDNGSISGCQNVDAKQKKIRQICHETCYPKIEHTCHVLIVNQKEVLAVVVGSEQDRPHFAGPAFIRKGAESVSASKEQFDALVHSRNSKTAAIMKLKGPVFTVKTVGCKLGDVKPIADRTYSQSCECRLIEVDAQTVRFYNISTSEHYTEPLEHIKVSRDEEKHRPMLIVARL